MFFCGVVSHAALSVRVDDVRTVTTTACRKVAFLVQHGGTCRAKAVDCTQLEVFVERVGMGADVCRVGLAGWVRSVADSLRYRQCVA